jgi:FkbM family methyltransferase
MKYLRFAKKTLNKFNIDIVRYRKHIDPLAFLANYNINTVIDAGANVGQFAEEIRRVLPNAHIHSFEPLEDCFLKLKNKFLNDSLFSGYNIALGEKKGKTNIHKNEYTPSSSLLHNSKLLDTAFPFAQKTTTEQITIDTLDTVLAEKKIKQNILFKLDVQGYEDKVLAGASQTLTLTSIVLIETSFYKLYEEQPLYNDIYKLLYSEGFDYHGSVHAKKHPETGEPLFEDSVFIKRSALIKN